MMEVIEAKYQQKDPDGNVVFDDEGKPVWKSAAIEYDFGDTLQDAIALCGEEVVHSQYKANAKLAVQAIIRTKLKSGMTEDQIQELVSNWKPGMVMERTTIDPATAIQNAFQTWPEEKKREFLEKLGVMG